MGSHTYWESVSNVDMLIHVLLDKKDYATQLRHSNLCWSEIYLGFTFIWKTCFFSQHFFSSTENPFRFLYAKCDCISKTQQFFFQPEKNSTFFYVVVALYLLCFTLAVKSEKKMVTISKVGTFLFSALM